VTDNADEGPGGNSRRPVVNDILYHSLSPPCPGQDRAAGMDECVSVVPRDEAAGVTECRRDDAVDQSRTLIVFVAQTPDLRAYSQQPEAIRLGRRGPITRARTWDRGKTIVAYFDHGGTMPFERA
jgi:hypothetical protein